RSPLHPDDADSIAPGWIVREQLERLTRRFQFLPETEDAGPVMLVDVVERDYPTRADERCIELEIALHTVELVVAVDEEEIDRVATESSLQLFDCSRIV